MGTVLKVWDGSAWVAKPIKVWSGSAWVTKTLRRWNGSAWDPAAAITGMTVVASFTGITTAGSATQASQAGDIFVAFAARANATLPTTPTGWTNLIGVTSATAVVRSLRMAVRYATGTATAINGTWTNATELIIVQFRPGSGKAIGVGGIATGTGATGQSTAPAYTVNTPLYGAANDKYRISAGYAASSGASNIEAVPPTASALITSVIGGAARELAAFWSTAVAAMAASIVTVSPSISWATANTEIIEYTPKSAPPYQDDFERATGVPLDLQRVATGTDGNWAWVHDGLVAAAMTMQSGVLRCETTDATGTFYAAPDMGNADHYAECVWGGLTTTLTGTFLVVRATDVNNFIGVRMGQDVFVGGIEIYRRNAGTLTALRVPAAGGEAAQGDTLRLQVLGSNWTFFKNGVSTYSGAIGTTMTGTKTGFVARTIASALVARSFKADL